jgi:glycosyltransferase involved in cell wall biosynthesis
VARLGAYWNAVVAVSDAIALRVTRLLPSHAARLTTIPYGVPIPDQPCERRFTDSERLRVVYAGRLMQAQKRVLDLPRIVTRALEQGVDMELLVAGAGDDGRQLRADCAPLVNRGVVRFLGTRPNAEVLRLFESADAMLLPSEFEGLPVSVIEAMGRGCVPVVSDVPSGIPKLIEDGVSGYRVRVGDVCGFARRLAILYRDPQARRAMGLAAHRAVLRGGYRVEDMARRYAELFERVDAEARSGAYRRRHGPIVPRPGLYSDAWKARLPGPVRAIGRRGKRAVRALASRARALQDSRPDS